MSLKEKFAAIKKKGFKINLISIPTRSKPQQIEHSIRTEFDRNRVIKTLERVQKFIDGIVIFKRLPSSLDLDQLSAEVDGLITHLKSYKE
jgi:hypothetical protein